MKLRQLSALLCALLLIFALAACKESAPQPAAPAEPAPAEPADDEFSMSAVFSEINSKKVSDFADSSEVTEYVKLSIQDHGELVLRLRPDIAPISVKNFQDLVGQGFYDGLTFHRVSPGFMIQGGDPEGTGGGGSGTNIKGEFALNGVENNLSHIRGVLSMARRTQPLDSASSQFFIVHSDSTFLDGSYAGFGYVVAGMDAVDSVCKVELGYNSGGELAAPLEPVIITSATFVAPK